MNQWAQETKFTDTLAAVTETARKQLTDAGFEATVQECVHRVLEWPASLFVFQAVEFRHPDCEVPCVATFRVNVNHEPGERGWVKWGMTLWEPPGQKGVLRGQHYERGERGRPHADVTTLSEFIAQVPAFVQSLRPQAFMADWRQLLRVIDEETSR